MQINTGSVAKWRSKPCRQMSNESLKSGTRKYHERELNLKYPADVPDCVTLNLSELINLQTANPDKKNKRLDDYL